MTDGSVHVIETIVVNAEGVKINHGIYRDIPTVMVNPTARKLYSDLSIEADRARRHRPSPTTPRASSNGERIYIGDADTYVESGVHQYVIDYTMTRMARCFADHDELYFNAIGQYWDFPIDSAVATVTLPEGAVISDLSGYTGGFGSNEQAVTISRDADNRATFRATRPFRPYEGLTVSAQLPEGHPRRADGDRQRPRLPLGPPRHLAAGDRRPAGAFLQSLGLVRRSAAIRPRARSFRASTRPRAFRRPCTHYVHRMGWQKSGWLAFTAGLVDLGVSGLVTLGKAGKKNTITATGATATDLPPEEASLFGYFSGRGAVERRQVDRAATGQADGSLQEGGDRLRGQGLVPQQSTAMSASASSFPSSCWG